VSQRFRKKVAAKDVSRELIEGQSPALLRAIGLLDKNGNLQADARRKLKQVNHLVNLLRPALEDALARHPQPVVVDAGAGNAYLGLVVHAMVLQPAGRGETVCIEQRPDLVARARERAASLGLQRFTVVEGRVADAPLPERVHVLMALHACDTATDDAILRGLGRRADHIAVVPCCQAEVAQQLKALGQELPDPALRPLWGHAWHRRELGSHLTNVIRALALEANGFQVTVTELAGWEHAVKNELLLARRVAARSPRARQALVDLLAKIPVRPAVLRDLDLGPGDDAARPEPAAGG
jgi:hypothetical protein